MVGNFGDVDVIGSIPHEQYATSMVAFVRVIVRVGFVLPSSQFKNACVPVVSVLGNEIV